MFKHLRDELIDVAGLAILLAACIYGLRLDLWVSP